MNTMIKVNKISISKKDYIKEKKEKIYCSYYFNVVYNKKPRYLRFVGKHPDVLIGENGRRIAIELTRYQNNEQEKQDVQYRNEIEKYFGQNLLINIYQKISKQRNETVTIRYKNKREMVNEILKSISIINEIEIDNNYWIRDGNSCIIMDNLKIDTMNLNDFLKYFCSSIESGKAIQIYLKKNDVSKVLLEIHFRYNRELYQKKSIDIEKFYMIDYNEDVIIDNIIDSVNSKIYKYSLSISDMKSNKVNYDEYKILVYGLRMQASVDEKKLYNEILKKVDMSKFDEIIILLFGKVLIITRKDYKIIKVK